MSSTSKRLLGTSTSTIAIPTPEGLDWDAIQEMIAPFTDMVAVIVAEAEWSHSELAIIAFSYSAEAWAVMLEQAIEQHDQDRKDAYLMGDLATLNAVPQTGEGALRIASAAYALCFHAEKFEREAVR